MQPHRASAYLRFALVLGGSLTLGTSCRDSATESTIAEARRTAGAVSRGLGQQLRYAYAAAHTVDAVFARIDSAVPGFGGYFHDESGRLVLRVRDRARAALVKEFIRRELGDLDLGAHPDAQLDAAAVDGADFGFSELAAFKARYYEHGDLTGVALVDLDERTNRMRIGVESRTSVDHVRANLQTLGIPGAATVVEVVGAFRPMALGSLFAKVRPTAGGLYTNLLKNGTSYAACTLGFNVQFTQAGDSPAPYAITAAHCATSSPALTEMGTVDATWVLSQPGNTYLDATIGAEVLDAGFAPGLTDCPEGAVCRYADASAFRYPAGADATGATVGAVVHPVNLNPGWWASNRDTIIVDQPFHVLAETYPIQNDFVYHVGQTTGWQTGNVSATCVDWRLDATRYLVCQTEVIGIAYEGDSGGPVFTSLNGDPSNGIALAGITSFAQCQPGYTAAMCRYYFSPVRNIHWEMGSFRATY